MNITIKETYEPIRMTYLNSKRREITVYGVFSYPTIKIGSDSYFRELSNPSNLIKSNDRIGIKVGTILEFEFLDITKSEK